jgi:ankyrin repeat protein
MYGLEDAINEGDLDKVKRLVAEGADVAEANASGDTALLLSAHYGHIPIMEWLLNEADSSLDVKYINGTSALLLAAKNGLFPAMRYLLEERGVLLTNADNIGHTMWDILYLRRDIYSAEFSSLLKVMVILKDAPADFITRLSLKLANICTRDQRFRALLPSYLKQQRAAVIAHCSLPAVLQSIVAEHATTTPKDMWTNGLRVHVPRAKRARAKNAIKSGKAEGEDATPLRRSRRLRQKRS